MLISGLRTSPRSAGPPRLIAEQTGGRANLIGIVCAEILAALGPGEQVIDATTVHAALAGGAVRNALGGWGMLGGPEAERTNRLDRLIVLATVGATASGWPSCKSGCTRWAPPYDAGEIEQALVRLDLSHIAGRDPDGVHRYRVPLLVEMPRDMDLDLALDQELKASMAGTD